MSIVQKALVLSLASLALAIPQAQLERRQETATTTTAPTSVDTCDLGPTSSAVDCLYEFPGLVSSFCGGFRPTNTITTTVTGVPTITSFETIYTSTAFGSTVTVTNASTITQTTTLTQTNNITSGLSTSFIETDGITTVTSFDYTCPGTTLPTASATDSSTESPTESPSVVLRNYQRQATATETDGSQASCSSYLSDYRDDYGRNAPCSCVVGPTASAVNVTSTVIVPTGTSTFTTTVTKTRGVLTSGVTTATSVPVTTVFTTSTEISNNTIPSIITATTTTSVSTVVVTQTTATPIPTNFRLNVTVGGVTLYGRQVQVNDESTAFAFTTGGQGEDFTINSNNDLVELANNSLSLAVLTEVDPNVIPYLFWQDPEDVPNNQTVLSVSACNGALTVPSASGDVFALCEGLDEDGDRLLALGSQELFASTSRCQVVEVGLDPAFVAATGNSTVPAVKARAAYYRAV